MPLIDNVLDGFEQRMKFINIVKALTKDTGTQAVRKMIPDKDVLDNVVLAVLVYIMENTLSRREKCTMESVAAFTEQLCARFEINTKDTEMLARYIVRDVLQNGGRLREFTVWNSAENEWQTVTLRLITEQSGLQLSEEAYDFLFRTKEIDSELDFSVARFKLQEQMKRKNYQNALEQSRELVYRIRRMKDQMDDFVFRCRENISKVTVNEFETIIHEIYTLLDEESKELSQQKQDAQRELDLLNGESSENLESVAQNRNLIRKIIGNLEMTIAEQRSLINTRQKMNELYRQILRDSFSARSFARYSAKDELLKPFWTMENNTDRLGDFACFLFQPISIPNFDGLFSIENYYAPQKKFNEKIASEELDIQSTEDIGEQKEQQRNQRYFDIIKGLFVYMKKHKHFAAHDYIRQMKSEELYTQCQENVLPQVLLTLYEMREIDVAAWKQSDDPVFEPNGEFELAWCLSQIEDMLTMKRISVYKQGAAFQFTVQSETEERTITMSNLEFEVTG